MAHNDYSLVQPHSTSMEFHATEDIEYPDVPPEVLAQSSIEDQITEMREWFRAWKWQRSTVRDYPNYFKPVLCYLEGAWVMSEQAANAVNGAFETQNSFEDASRYWDMTKKHLYHAATGSNDVNERTTFLPMKIANLYNDGTEPTYAQWHYRTLCAPIRDIPIGYFRGLDDLADRVRFDWEGTEFYQRTRRPRFFPNEKDGAVECWHRICYLDTLMEQIPGVDNYPGNLTDNSFGPLALTRDHGVLNSAYYHRSFRHQERGAMGSNIRRRGWSDRLIYMAQTTSERVLPVSMIDCKGGNCAYYNQRWTYAIPLEVIYLTPLHKWNPYGIPHYGKNTPFWNSMIAEGRDGHCSRSTAFTGTTSNNFYRVPKDFYVGHDNMMKNVPEEDTGRDYRCVLINDQTFTVMASGIHIHLPRIPRLGMIRTRYPIFPIYAEGSATYKELDALKHATLDPRRYRRVYPEYPPYMK